MSKIVGVVGATGLVGSQIIKRLEERDLDIDIVFLASKSSVGQIIRFKDKDYKIKELNEENIKGIDYLLFAAGGQISKKYAEIAVKNGSIVIDNSSQFRMDKDVPLIIPEVNPQAIKSHKGIIANPNCSTIQSVISIYPIYKEYGIERIIYSTYQSVSGSGVEGLADLDRTIKGEDNEFYPEDIAYNLIPHIDDFLDNGYTKEEVKMIDETNKILDKDIRVTATTVRVPIKYAHAVSINVETKDRFNIDDVFNLYRDNHINGLVLEDDIKEEKYPTPILAQGNDNVYVGRLRKDYSIDNGINLWCVSDNIRKGASTNAVQILELLLEDK